jgi:hypothetical protein
MSVAPRIKSRVASVLPQESRLCIANERKARSILTRALGSLCRSGSFALVKMMQAADLRDLDHLAKEGGSTGRPTGASFLSDRCVWHLS